MFGYFSYYSTFPPLSAFSSNQTFPRFTYPLVDTKIFSHSVHSFPPLMEQGRLLLTRLGDMSFARSIMEAAQKGDKEKVDRIVNSIGLAVPITTHYTPSDVNFTLHSRTDHHFPCCTLCISLKWGQ